MLVVVNMPQSRRARWVRHILRQAINAKRRKPANGQRSSGDRPCSRKQKFAAETLLQGRSPIERHCPHRIVFLISSSFDFVTKSLGEETEDDAAVADCVEEQLDVEEPERNVVETPSKSFQREKHSGPRRNFGALRFLSLTSLVFPCTPDFGPGTSALRAPLRARLGYNASFLSVASEQALRMTHADSTGAGQSHRQQTCCATGAAAGVDFNP